MPETIDAAAPRVSVIVPVFNRAGSIPRALESVAAQTFQDYEIIVVDDGSTDGSADVVERLGLARVRLIRSPQNRGAAAARNIGISAASGQWIAFLDSDDFWAPDKLAHQLAALEGAPPPSSWLAPPISICGRMTAGREFTSASRLGNSRRRSASAARFRQAQPSSSPVTRFRRSGFSTRLCGV